jgi:hypothetical protein
MANAGRSEEEKGEMRSYSRVSSLSTIAATFTAFLNEVPGLEDWLEPGVEFFVGGDLVQEAAVDEPDLARVVHPRRIVEKLDAARAVNDHIARIDFHT